MKSILLVVGISLMMGGVAFGKAPWKKETAFDCKECHVQGKFKEVPKDGKTAEMYQAAADKGALMAGGEKAAKISADRKKELTARYGALEGKKSCNDCHKGEQHPKKQ